MFVFAGEFPSWQVQIAILSISTFIIEHELVPYYNGSGLFTNYITKRGLPLKVEWQNTS